MTFADGRRVKHPRAANFVWNLRNGKYLYWFHNHADTWYEDRNPVWVAGNSASRLSTVHRGFYVRTLNRYLFDDFIFHDPLDHYRLSGATDGYGEQQHHEGREDPHQHLLFEWFEDMEA